MQESLFPNTQNMLRNISWIAIFISVILPPAFPVVLISEWYKFAFTMLSQSVKIIAGAIISQLRQMLSDSEMHRTAKGDVLHQAAIKNTNNTQFRN